MNPKWLVIGDTKQQAEFLRELAGMVESGKAGVERADMSVDCGGMRVELRACVYHVPRHGVSA